MGQKKAKNHHVSLGKSRLTRAALPFSATSVLVPQVSAWYLKFQPALTTQGHKREQSVLHAQPLHTLRSPPPTSARLFLSVLCAREHAHCVCFWVFWGQEVRGVAADSGAWNTIYPILLAASRDGATTRVHLSGASARR